MSDRQEELDWTAFRYVAGEMSAEEATEFEARLAESPEACEAVSRAFGLTAASADGRPPADRAVARPSALGRIARAAGWMTVGAAAASLAFWLARPTEPSPETPKRPSPVAGTGGPKPDAGVWARLSTDDPFPDVAVWQRSDSTEVTFPAPVFVSPNWLPTVEMRPLKGDDE